VKTKRLIPAAVIIILVAIGGLLLFFNTATTPRPMLVFRGYEISATNTNAIAKLELRNTTGRDIWLCYSGNEPPLRPPFLEKAAAVPPNLTNNIRTNVYSYMAMGSIFLVVGEVLPGDSVRLEFPLSSGVSAKHVGITYFVGKFSGERDFLRHYFKRYLVINANWKDKAAFYWQRLRGKFKAPERHEIWCEDLISFQDAITNSPPR
jgi:hypothetical protein